MPADIPMASGPKTKATTVKLTPDQYRLVDQRAKRCGLRLAQWMRSILIQAATRRPDAGYLRIREPDGVTL
jgi:hypothetical protein